PIVISQKHSANHYAKALICNSGVANTCSEDGIKLGLQVVNEVALLLQEEPSNILISSTGVIGQRLPIELISNALPSLISEINNHNGYLFADAIQTTDTYEKEYQASFMIGLKEVRLGACAKGSGMVNPNMATVLGYLTCDIKIKADLLDEIFKEVVDDTLNMINIDNQTSTNDMALIMCNGQAQNDEIIKDSVEHHLFKEELMKCLKHLTKLIAFDGEGATKLLMVKVINASDQESARNIAKEVIGSDLVKSAFFASDANWGRIIVALGNSKAIINHQNIDVYLSSSSGQIQVAQDLVGLNFCEEQASTILQEKQVEVIIDLKDQQAHACAYGCDLSYDYIKINTNYRKG
ncbi:MAG: bifunctional glutamate N-acetyltransferase/amino-acid acetyltransferase ArgJ, partial [Bacilli bacterium]